MRLKDYVDFITSLAEMDEVKNGKFTVPSLMEFNLERRFHKALHKEVVEAKDGELPEDLHEPFEMVILGVELKFEHVGYE